MSDRSSFAPGKIILSGEYAMLFGKPGIAMPAKQELHMTWKETRGAKDLTIEPGHGIDHPLWMVYIQRIVRLCEKKAQRKFTGTLEIDNTIPAGKGMGSSTAMVIAAARCFLGEDSEAAALEIEDKVNPSHSGMDFAVIWNVRPIVYDRTKGWRDAEIDMRWMAKTILIDTGTPNEPTPELVAWIKVRHGNGDSQIAEAVSVINTCTERLVAGGDPASVIRDHHKAQIQLGVVPKDVQALITKIEKAGGAAKVIGAGARTGGGGMVLAFHDKPATIKAAATGFPIIP